MREPGKRSVVVAGPSSKSGCGGCVVKDVGSPKPYSKEIFTSISKLAKTL
jgi:hypothetical protein